MGKFTMGKTLHSESESLSGGNTNVTGSSLEISTHTRTISIDENCYKSPQYPLKKELMADFDNLPLVIDKPWLKHSWQLYDTFLKNHGSHLRTQVKMGALIRQWAFAKSSFKYSKESLSAKACLDLYGLHSGFVFHVNGSCSEYSKEAYDEAKKLQTQGDLDIIGGQDATRHALQQERSPELIEKLMNEARVRDSPIGQKFISIWDLILMRYGTNKTRHTKAMNLKQYYEGFKDFGCDLIEIENSEGEKLKARAFKYRNDDNTVPSFQCQLINQGCQSDSDCHIGGGGFVTYCHGATCLEYLNGPFGSKAKHVAARKGNKGGYSEGINRSCYYHGSVRAKCRKNFFSKGVIWDGARGGAIYESGSQVLMSNTCSIIVSSLLLIVMYI